MHGAQGVYPDGVGRGVPDEPTGHEWGFSLLPFPICVFCSSFRRSPLLRAALSGDMKVFVVE